VASCFAYCAGVSPPSDLFGRSSLYSWRQASIMARAWASDGLRGLAARAVALIRVEAVWLAVEPLDLRAGMESVLNRVVTMFGAARPHHAYLFANRRANRIKVLA